MTPQQRKEATRYLQAFDFSGLFTDPAIGWDWPGSGRPLQVPVGDGFIALEAIAEKRGVRILHVPHQSDGTIMPSESRKKLEKAVTPLAAEHLLPPFLLQKVAAKLQGSAGVPPASKAKASGQDAHAPLWDVLKNDPDRYIYPAVRHGAGNDVKAWKKSLPENIAIGLDSRSVGVSPTSKATKVGETPTLLERRKHWNTPSPATSAAMSFRKNSAPVRVKEPADLVTHNLYGVDIMEEAVEICKLRLFHY